MILDRLESTKRDSDGLISLSNFAHRQTVLFVRTRVEEGLSALISFSSLRPKSLPIERPDATNEGMDVIRVSLATAVRFIVDLEKREDSANPTTEVAMENLNRQDSSLNPLPPEDYGG